MEDVHSVFLYLTRLLISVVNIYSVSSQGHLDGLGLTIQIEDVPVVNECKCVELNKKRKCTFGSKNCGPM